MKRPRLRAAFFSTILAFACAVSLPAHAKYRYQLTPSISVGEEYDDNINLTSVNEESDYITTITPAIDFGFFSQKTTLHLIYAPTFVWYAHQTENDTVRQFGSVTLGQQLSRHWTFDFSDSFLYSDDPLQDVQDVGGLRRTRNTYTNNDANASFSYLFGPANRFSFGYANFHSDNSQANLDDLTTQNFFSNVDYWLDVKNGLSLNGAYTKGDFSRDNLSTAGNDYTGFNIGPSYHRRFSLHTLGSVNYEFVKRDYEQPSNLPAGALFDRSYKVHNVTIGLDHAFSSDLSVSLSGGFYIQQREVLGNQTGPLYAGSLIKNFNRGSARVGANGGWYESYLDATRRGFTRYNNVNAGVTYQLLQRLQGRAAGAYQENKDALNREWKTYGGTTGLLWSFMRWYTLSLDYTYAKRNDDVSLNDYTDNRVMLRFTAQKPFNWQK